MSSLPMYQVIFDLETADGIRIPDTIVTFDLIGTIRDEMNYAAERGMRVIGFSEKRQEVCAGCGLEISETTNGHRANDGTYAHLTYDGGLVDHTPGLYLNLEEQRIANGIAEALERGTLDETADISGIDPRV